MIHILSDETINKIAAGEVVERPANALKELIENSLDAQSGHIVVELRGAGRRLIRVQDDGTGMSRDDMGLAVTRHATSKIKEFDDLDALSTLGFRGEALPSIAAVSRLNIKSRARGSAAGWELNITGGKITDSRAWSGNYGTSIEAEDLFFNTPAREKFLKSDVTERSRLLGVIEELALSRHDVGFGVVSEGKTSLNAPRAKTIVERITDVLGKDFSGRIVPVGIAHPHITLSGFVTRSQDNLPTRAHQYLFINRRPVRMSKNIMHALYEAYREHLPAGKHPGAVLYLELDPSAIDVNVHPAKRDVRFANERELHDILYRAIRNAVVQPIAITLPDTPDTIKRPANSTASINETTAPYRPRPLSHEARVPVASPNSPAHAQGDFAETILKDELPRALGQVLGVYIVAQIGNELVIIDQHAAAERIRYERYIDEWQKHSIAAHGLLIPATIELAPSKAALLKSELDALKEAGWEVEEFGSGTFRLTAIPAVLGSDGEARGLLLEVIDALEGETALPKGEKIEAIIRAACRSSIKARDHVAPAEMAQLINDLFLCRAPYTCPHGRPTLLKLTKSELEKHFNRK